MARVHALQGVSLSLDAGVLSVVGRNGMGKTTLCNTITGLKRARGGSIRLNGREISSLEPHEIHRLGVGYVPQGRRTWASLTVDEHLRLIAGNRRDASWTVERIYQTFPRLAERKSNGGSQLSGGEQQMLAISRALLSDPKLLVMDEPTEGLAPVIVEQVERMLVSLAEEGEMSILVIEQNIGVATAVADRVAIMVNGRINRLMEAKALANDRELQQRLLGVGRHSEEEPAPAAVAAAEEQLDARLHDFPRQCRYRRAVAKRRLPAGHLPAEPLEPAGHLAPAGIGHAVHPSGRPYTRFPDAVQRADRPHRPGRRHLRHEGKGTALHRRAAARSWHSDAHRRSFDLRQALDRRGQRACRSRACIPRGTSEVFSDDRGRSVAAMAEAFAALDRPRARHRRRHLRRRLGRHGARHRRHAGAAGRHPEDHGLDRHLGRCRPLCRRHRHHDVQLRRRCAGAEFDH